MSLTIQQIRDGIYSPEIRKQYEARLEWAEKALTEIEQVFEYGVETTEYFQILDNHRRIEQTIVETRKQLQNYRECTCGSGYTWTQCPGHPETGTMYCG